MRNTVCFLVIPLLSCFIYTRNEWFHSKNNFTFALSMYYCIVIHLDSGEPRNFLPPSSKGPPPQWSQNLSSHSRRPSKLGLLNPVYNIIIYRSLISHGCVTNYLCVTEHVSWCQQEHDAPFPEQRETTAFSGPPNSSSSPSSRYNLLQSHSSQLVIELSEQVASLSGELEQAKLTINKLRQGNP